MRHSVGCPEFTNHPIAVWLEENRWLSAILGISLGIIFSIFGKRLFPWIAGIIAGVCVLYTIISISGALKLLEKRVEIIATLLFGTGVAIVIGDLIRRSVWFAVKITGVVAGLALGNLVYDFLLTAADFESIVGYIVIVGLFAASGGALTFKYTKEVVVFGTSLVGSYAFVRGCSMIFGGWPSEEVIVNHLRTGADLDLQWPFYVYLVAIIAMFALTAWWQNEKEEHHEDVKKHNEDDEYQRAKNDP